jgi:hypothetical protein
METKRNIEKLLSAFSKKRKTDAGAPLEIHPANRRLLQDEVARSVKKPGVEGSSFWINLFASNPRRAFALGVLVSLGISVVLLLPALKESKSKTVLAQNKSSVAKDLKKAAPPAPAAAPTVAPVQLDAPVMTAPVVAPEIASAKLKASDAIVLEDRSGLPKESGQKLGTDGVRPASVNAPVVASQNVTRSFGGGGGGGAGGRGGGEGFGGARLDGDATVVANGATSSVNLDAGITASGTVVPAAATTLAFDKQPAATYAVSESRTATTSIGGSVSFKNLAPASGQNASQTLSQNFYRQRMADEAKSGTSILDSFAFEQSGDQITVVDADGSKYSGIVQIAAVNEENGFVAKQTSPVAQSARLAAAAPQRRESVATNSAVVFSYANQQQVASPNFYFRVTGTNRTLNQAVVFSGNLVANTNAIVVGNTGSARAFQQVQPQVIQQLPLLNSRITGRVSVGGKSDIQINAVPVAP